MREKTPNAFDGRSGGFSHAAAMSRTGKVVDNGHLWGWPMSAELRLHGKTQPRGDGSLGRFDGPGKPDAWTSRSTAEWVYRGRARFHGKLVVLSLQTGRDPVYWDLASLSCVVRRAVMVMMTRGGKCRRAIFPRPSAAATRHRNSLGEQTEATGQLCRGRTMREEFLHV